MIDKNKNIKLPEFRNILHLTKDECGEDVHLVKEINKDSDGNIEENIRIIKNYKRPFWITKPIFRHHKDKKETEDIKKLNMYKSTESDLFLNAKRHLGLITAKNMRDIRMSPYIYGIDIDAKTFIKRKYLKTHNFNVTPYRIGVFDIEVELRTDEIIIIGLATKKEIKTALLRKYANKIPNLYKEYKIYFEKYIPDEFPYKKQQLENMELKVFDTEIEMIKWIFKEANTMEIDFLTGWNIRYDIGKILEVCEKENVDPADIFHYDKIPLKYKYFKFIEGRTKKVTESGKEIPINIEEQWHVYRTSSNYKLIDAMSTHRYIRVGQENVPGGYSLNNILDYEGIPLKLKFGDSEALQSNEWHLYMTENKPLEYIIYNNWDLNSIIMLDDKTKDLQVSLPLLSGISDFDIFNSGPKRLVNEFFFFALEHGRILGTKDPNMDKDKILGLDDWIVTLKPHLLKDNGLKLIKELPNLRTNIRTFVFDADAVSSYPSNIYAANVSKDTTHRELIKVEGFDKKTFKEMNIDLMFGITNALTYSQTMFKLPGLFKIQHMLEANKLVHD